MTVVAAFDLDGTITDRDCLVRFTIDAVGHGALLQAIGRHVLMHRRSLTRRDEVKRAMSSSLRGKGVDEIDAVARQFVDQRVVRWFRADTIDRLEQHRAAGHQLVIVSASYEVYVRHIAARLGAAAVATRLASDDGYLTGELEGSNCRGAEKVTRLQQWLRDVHNLSMDEVELHAYGDSSGDTALLEAANQRCLVTPRRRWSPV